MKLRQLEYEMYIVVVLNEALEVVFYYRDDLGEALDTLVAKATKLGGCSIIDLEEKKHYYYNNKLQLKETKKFLDK